MKYGWLNTVMSQQSDLRTAGGLTASRLLLNLALDKKLERGNQ